MAETYKKISDITAYQAEPADNFYILGVEKPDDSNSDSDSENKNSTAKYKNIVGHISAISRSYTDGACKAISVNLTAFQTSVYLSADSLCTDLKLSCKTIDNISSIAYNYRDTDYPNINTSCWNISSELTAVQDNLKGLSVATNTLGLVRQFTDAEQQGLATEYGIVHISNDNGGLYFEKDSKANYVSKADYEILSAHYAGVSASFYSLSSDYNSRKEVLISSSSYANAKNAGIIKVADVKDIEENTGTSYKLNIDDTSYLGYINIDYTNVVDNDTIVVSEDGTLSAKQYEIGQLLSVKYSSNSTSIPVTYLYAISDTSAMCMFSTKVTDIDDCSMIGISSIQLTDDLTSNLNIVGITLNGSVVNVNAISSNTFTDGKIDQNNLQIFGIYTKTPLIEYPSMS